MGGIMGRTDVFLEVVVILLEIGLGTYLADGRIELSNNRAERSIKSFVISRKNFLFANTA